ncbi:ABC transporter permease [Dysosmobacter sp.]|uniref:ABC transporter permease n=1 Tax=Dysosmobacter sp. TaxID=2591382 RepID=UPI002A8EDB6C|nr:ABC transporter permease [Dysosmobacter sp.]MDY3281075.1 ABC transporter permease [Dysosmobacter sp.]
MNRSTLRKILQAYGTVLALAAIVAVFSLIRPDKFCTVKNFINITRQISLLVMISLGTTLVMSVNEFDLSVGSMASLGGVMAALMAVRGLPMAVCFLAPAAVSFVIGLLNGWIVARFRVLSFITTLGMSTVLSGVIYRLSGGATVFEGIPRSFSVPGTAKVGDIPVLSILMVVFVALFFFLLEHTTLGRKFYAIGGSEETAKIAGIRVRKYKTIAFALCSVMACVTGMLIASRVGSANTTAGDGYFLQSYAAVFIGCTVSRRGIPNAVGTLVGAAILGILANGLTILQMPSYMQNIITGGIIILAVIAQRAGRGDAV